MNDTARIRHYVRLIATCESTFAAPEKNLIGLLANKFAYTPDELLEVEKNLTFIRLKYSGLELTEKSLTDIVQTNILFRSDGLKDRN